MFFRRRAPTPTEPRTPTDSAAAGDGPADEIDRLLARVKAKPKDATRLADLVGLLAKAKRDDEAAVHAVRLLELRPANRRALRVLTRAPRAGVDVVGGWRAFAITAPDDPEPWLQIARLAARANDRQTSLEACDEALGRDPRQSEVLTLKIAALQALGLHGALAPVWSVLNQVDPERAAVALARAVDADEQDSAVVMLGAARIMGPLDARMEHETLRLRARLTVDGYAAELAGDDAAAAEAFRRLGRLEPDQADHADGLRRALARLREPTAGAGEAPGADLADMAPAPPPGPAEIGLDASPEPDADPAQPDESDLGTYFDETADLG